MGSYPVCHDKRKPMPAWLVNPPKRHSRRNGYAAWRYWRKLWFAQPLWADVERIRAVYACNRAMRAAGNDTEVDHVIPLTHPLVCGLHVPSNLQILPRRDNAAKSNHHWPNMPDPLQQELDYGLVDDR